MKNALIFALASVILAACGGGGGDPQQPQVTPKAIYPVPVLRPCETTGPNAPPCAASQAAGVR